LPHTVKLRVDTFWRCLVINCAENWGEEFALNKNMNRPLFLHRLLLRFYFLSRMLIRFYILLPIFISVCGALDSDPLLLRKTAKKFLVECGFGQFNMYFVA